MRASLAIAMAFVICGVAAGPALADHDDHHRGRRGYERHDRGWHGQRGHFFYPERNVFYAPPPILYTSPVYPSSGFTFVFPLWIH